MYRKRSQYFIKHTDFMAVDLLCLLLAFFLSCRLVTGQVNEQFFRRHMVVLLILDVLIAYMWDAFLDVLSRDVLTELAACLKHVLRVMIAMVLFLYFTLEANNDGRGILLYTGFLYLWITFFLRLLWKVFLKKLRKKSGTLSIHLVTTRKTAPVCIRNIKKDNNHKFRITGITIVDQDCRGTQIEGIPVVSGRDDLIEYVCQNWIDELFLCLTKSEELPDHIMNTLTQIGVVLHQTVSDNNDLLGKKQSTEKIGGYVVLTTALHYATTGQLLVKRMMDIAGGLIGCLITGILYIIIAPQIKLVSPGPVFFKQERVGMNGKHFYIYKFRTMYMDAEERKQDLMDENRIDHGYMFKCEHDPRIIGSKILPNGEYKKGLGNFLRDYSLDEFPQFWNVLTGSMSIVGTRPPTLDEVDHYQPHHHARLAVKPGITGVWQVSGRSNITDFEEVVKMDLKYINEWSLLLDIKIILRTIRVVFKREGSM